MGAYEYPDDAALDAIENWPYDDFIGLMEFIRPLWEPMGSFKGLGNSYELATGGWSGNETTISYMRKNFVFWSMCWQSSHRGGLYRFRLKEVA